MRRFLKAKLSINPLKHRFIFAMINSLTLSDHGQMNNLLCFSERTTLPVYSCHIEPEHPHPHGNPIYPVITVIWDNIKRVLKRFRVQLGLP
jgi:hypothetical protein